MDEFAIFTRALDIEHPTERAAFLQQACGEDAQLRARIEALLESHQAAGSFLQALPLAGSPVTVDLVSAERPGTQIGPYKLLQQIGEGGMGVVYMAEQSEPIARRVALKIIKPGMDTRQVIARFEAERQALALMDHANIARVLDAGTIGEPDASARGTATSLAYASGFPGRPYFVMELVHGVPITKYCDDNHLTPRQRLELFVPVCQAIQHAHQKGIIHRDIKPSNVMVTLYDGKPVPKVIDFGVAKATEQKLTERTLFTQHGTMVGTLEYMSPEQAEMSALGVDTRSDIYSLGVLLYELLTGSTPLTHKRMKEAAYAEILRMIKEEEPPKPSTRLSELSSHHAPRDEPGSVTRSVTTTLASIAALRNTEPAKLTKLVRGELDWIVMKCLEKDRNRRYETADGFAADVQRYLADEPVQACPPSAWYRFRKFARRNGRAVVTVAVVAAAVLLAAGTLGWAMRDRAAREQELARDQAVRQASLQQQIVWALAEVENSYQRGKLPEAWAAVKQAEGLLGMGDASQELTKRVRQWRHDLTMVTRLEEIRLEKAAIKDGHYDNANAIPAYRNAFQEYGLDLEALDPGEAAERIRSAAIKDLLVAVLDDWWTLTRGKGLPGWKQLQTVSRRADPDPWRNQFREVLDSGDYKILAELARDQQLLAQPPVTLLLLARACNAAGQVPLAVEVLRQAQQRHADDFWINHNLAGFLGAMKPAQDVEDVGFYRAAVALRPESPGAHHNLGTALARQGMLQQAILSFRRAIELKADLAAAYYGLGKALNQQGKLEGAIAAYRKAIDLKPGWAEAHGSLGFTLQAQGKLEEAIAAHRKSIELKPDLALAHSYLGSVLEAQGKLEEAMAAHRKAVELEPDSAECHSHLGGYLERRGKLDEAFTSALRSIELKPNSAQAHYILGVILGRQGHRDKAILAYRKTIELEPRNAEAHNNLGSALYDQGRVVEAIDEFCKAIESKPGWAMPHFNLARLLATWPDTKFRDVGRAVELAKKAVELDPQSIFAWQMLGWAQYRAGNWQASIQALEKSCELEKGGDCGQWIVLALSHARLGNQTSLPEQERVRYQAQARRRYDQAIKQIDGHPGLRDPVGQAIRAFREEAAEQIHPKKEMK